MNASFFVRYDTKNTAFDYCCLQKFIGVHVFNLYDTRYTCMTEGTIFVLEL